MARGKATVATSFRLSAEAHDYLTNASLVWKKSMAAIVEEALADYKEKHPVSCSYHLSVSTDRLVLVRVSANRVEVVENVPRNGVPPEEMAKRYEERLNQHVGLTISEGTEPWATSRSS